TGAARTRKLLSTTGNYADAIIAGARALLLDAGAPAADVREIIHGTTVATNAILERQGTRTGLITTEGFRDLLEIGRLRLARLYDLNFERPAPLVPRRWRREVRERMNHRGEVVTPLDRESVVEAVDRLLAEGVIATAALARRVGAPNAISIDMGGTTAKASVIEAGAITRAGEFEIGGVVSQGSRLNKGSGFLLRVPAIDIAEVGAGGGSIVT